ncbi:hypothetical protein PBAL39_20550 [Pedobacter sp. BAL39]|uniref:DUF6603 domain-containing protein n=1 Tax=Pedobacter sp. BAL39 TaxID=391596 RepID=UPI000155926B|nr:DUF6603 domain-containing protein [Pedobacter sp. BAL39]EDM38501.1 hypothetical protein PBAL39_20550 [Pedobacter sp. BAL39]
MEGQAVYLSLDVVIYERTFRLEGLIDKERTVLRASASEVKPIIAGMTRDIAILSFLEDILPDTVEFSLIMAAGKKNLFSISASFGGGTVEISIVRAENFSMFSLWLNQEFYFSDLPLVGEYIPRQYQFMHTGLVYVAKTGAVPRLSAEDFSGISFPALEKIKSKDSPLSFVEGVNAFVHLDAGAGDSLIAFPEDLLVEGKPAPESDLRELKSGSAEEKPSALSITEISLGADFENGNKLIKILLSAKLAISKFTFEVIGLQVGIDLDQTLKSLKSMREQPERNKMEVAAELGEAAHFSIQGLSLQYSSAAFSMSGGFYREIAGDSEAYNGLIAIKIKQIEIIALGSYVKEKSYSSLFAFGYLGISIPLHPAFEIKGFALGFGLNRSFTLPAIQEVEDFPLIKIVRNNGLRPGESLKAVFSKLQQYIPVREGSYVVMIGLRFQSFKIIDTLALASLTIEKGLMFQMLGLSVMEVPGVYKIKFAFSLQADFNSGVVIARGEITRGSYLLFPEVQLQGSFVFAMWFSGSVKGDFLFTIGGYHPNFKVPKHYPEAVELSRLGFALRRGNLSANLGMYFALTPQAIMFGLIGNLHYSMDLSKDVTIDYWIGSKTFTFTIGVEVDIKLEAHLILFWKPFSYRAELELLFHVRLYADFSLFSVNIHVSLQAKLSIWGPDLAGIASLSVAGYYFTVRFGEASAEGRQLSKEAFVKEFIPEDHLKLSITAGKISEDMVDPVNFVLELGSQIPISEISIEGGARISGHEAFGANCEGCEGIAFSHGVTIEIMNGWQRETQWQIEPIRQNMPKALWSLQKLSQSSVLSSEGLMKNLTTGLRIRFPEPAKGSRLKLEEISAFEETEYQYREEEQKKTWIMEHSEAGDHILSIDLEVQRDDFDFILPVDEADTTDLVNKVEAYTYNTDFKIFRYS